MLNFLLTNARRIWPGLKDGATRNAMFALACLLTLAAMSGCASMGGIAPKSSLRDVNAIASEASLKNLSPLSAAWPTENWWRRYGDVQLDQLIEEAFRESPSLRIAEARVRQARAAVGLAESATAPQVNGTLKSTRQHYSENSIVPKPLAGTWAWYNDASINFGYEFDFWGKNHAGIEAVVGRAKASEADSYASRLMLAVAITQTYLRLEQSFEQLELAEAVLKTRQEVWSITRQRVDAQIDSELELKQADLSIPVAREQIAQLQEGIALIRNQLAALLGQGPDRGLRIERPHLTVVSPTGVPANLSVDLLGRRPDVVAQRWRVEALSQDISVAKAQFYPNINLIGLIGFQSLGFSNFLNAGSRIAGIGPAVSLPIFDGGRLRSNLAARTAEYDIAVEQYNQTLIDSIRDVVSQLTSIQWLQEHVRHQEQALSAAQQAYQLSIQRYRSGLGNYLQVLIAEGQVLAQQHAQIDLNARALDLDINLVRALGGGYHNAPIVDEVSTKSFHLAGKENE